MPPFKITLPPAFHNQGRQPRDYYCQYEDVGGDVLGRIAELCLCLSAQVTTGFPAHSSRAPSGAPHLVTLTSLSQPQTRVGSPQPPGLPFTRHYYLWQVPRPEELLCGGVGGPNVISCGGSLCSRARCGTDWLTDCTALDGVLSSRCRARLRPRQDQLAQWQARHPRKPIPTIELPMPVVHIVHSAKHRAASNLFFLTNTDQHYPNLFCKLNFYQKNDLNDDRWW